MAFEARYFGECGGCDEPINKGEQVEYRDGFVCHVECKEVTLPQQLTLCPVCWQVPSLSGVCGC